MPPIPADATVGPGLFIGTCRSADPLTSPPSEWPRTVYNRGMHNDPPPPFHRTYAWSLTNWNCTGCPRLPLPRQAPAAPSRTAWPWVGRLWPRRLACACPRRCRWKTAIATVEAPSNPGQPMAGKTACRHSPAVHPAHAQPIAARGGRGCRRGAVHATRPAVTAGRGEPVQSPLQPEIHRPGAPDTALPQRAEWAAALLILREGLHRLGRGMGGAGLNQRAFIRSNLRHQLLSNK